MQYFYEKNLTSYESYTNEELIALWRNKGDEKARVVASKRLMYLTGDVFFHNGYIINLKKYLEQNPNSTATTIEEAGAEYIALIEAQQNLAE